MKPSILIAMLQQILAEHGDVEMWGLSDNGESFPVDAIVMLDATLKGKMIAVFISGDLARKVIDEKTVELTFQAIEKARKKGL